MGLADSIATVMGKSSDSIVRRDMPTDAEAEQLAVNLNAQGKQVIIRGPAPQQGLADSVKAAMVEPIPEPQQPQAAPRAEVDPTKAAGYADVTPASSTPQYREGEKTLSSLITGSSAQQLNPLQTRMIGHYVPPNKSTMDINEAAYGVGGALTDVGTAIGLPPSIAAIPGALANVGVQSFGMGPGGAVKGAGTAINAIGRGARAGGRFLADAAGYEVAPAARSAFGSVGSAGTSGVEMARTAVQNASPQLKDAVERGIKSGTPINQRILDNYVAAESLPRPVFISKGQASGNPVLISQERNLRGKFPEFAEGMNRQNKELAENFPFIRDKAAPEAFGTNQVQHGGAAIDSYKALDAARNKVISANYKALEDANGGQFPMDVRAFVKDATEQLHKTLKYNHVPPEIAKDIKDIQKNGMTFESFEALRTNLSRVQRTSSDGNQRAAAGVIRDALERMPMPETTVGSSLEGSATVGSNLKQLADKARTSAKERFDAIDADPAYKAVVNGKAVADNFIPKHIISGSTKDVERLMTSLDDGGRQSVRAGVLDVLQKTAMGGETGGNFSQAAYNKALDKIRTKLPALFEPETIKELETLGRVAKLTQDQPVGSFVNNSNTLVGALAEGVANTAGGVAAAHGVPVGWIRKQAEKISERRAVREAFRPGAGVLLKDLP